MSEEQCGKAVGTRPWWMGVDQYVPCPCILPKGHEGWEHKCIHTIDKEDQGLGGAAGGADGR